MIIARKTLNYLKWLTENEPKYKYKLDLEDAFIKKFKICSKHFKRIWLVYKGEKKNTTPPLQQYRNQIKRNKEMCFFCLKKV